MIYIFLISLLVVSNVIMDLSSENLFNISYWNKSESWTKKWKTVIINNKYVKKEKFWGSSRWFVSFTDGWHLSQFVFHTSWQLLFSLTTNNPLLCFIGIKLIFSGLFELLYTNLKNILIGRRSR